MNKFMIAAMGTSVLMAACSTSATANPAPAFAAKPAGAWVLNPAKCPDLVEDHRDRLESRKDERFDRNRRDVIEDRLDRRESRADEAVTRCPASAWQWRGPAYNKRLHPVRPQQVTVYYNNTKRHYFYSLNKSRVIIRF